MYIVVAQVTVLIRDLEQFGMRDYGLSLRFQLRTYIHNHKIVLPVAVIANSNKDYEVVMDNASLASCHGDASDFVKKLRAAIG